MKHRLFSIVLAFLLILSVSLGAVGGAVAQDNSTNNSTEEDEPPQSAPAPDSSDEGGDLWSVYRESNETTASGGDILKSIGPNLKITGVDYQSDGTAEVTFTAEITTSVTLQDASALDPDAAVSSGEYRSVTIPRGTHRVIVPATIRGQQGLQMVSVSYDGTTTQLSNQNVEQDFFEDRPLWIWFIYFLIVAGLGAAVYLIRQIRSMDTGAIETSEGIQLDEEFEFGSERLPQVESEQDGDSDE